MNSHDIIQQIEQFQNFLRKYNVLISAVAIMADEYSRIVPKFHQLLEFPDPKGKDFIPDISKIKDRVSEAITKSEIDKSRMEMFPLLKDFAKDLQEFTSLFEPATLSFNPVTIRITKSFIEYCKDSNIAPDLLKKLEHLQEQEITEDIIPQIIEETIQEAQEGERNRAKSIINRHINIFKDTPLSKQIDIAVKRFVAAYQDYTYTPNDKVTGVNLVATGKNLYTLIKTANIQLQAIRTQLETDHIAPNLKNNENWDTLSLYFPLSTSFEKLIDKLQALKSLYSTICEILDINETEYPMQIIKIEIGCEWYHILINKLAKTGIVASLTKFANTVVNISNEITVAMYRKVFDKGKLDQIDENAKRIVSMVDYLPALEAAGITTKKSKENLQASFENLTEQLIILTDNKPNITVDDEIIQLGIANIPFNSERKLIEGKEQPALPPAPANIEQKEQLNQLAPNTNQPETNSNETNADTEATNNINEINPPQTQEQ